MNDSAPLDRRCGQGGQVLPLLALCIVIIILFIGLAIDFGFAYVTKANLSKAVDAAALAGIRSVTLQGEAGAKAIALNAFNMNYALSGRDAKGIPTPTIEFVNDASGAKYLTVSATATINTFFIRILPQWTTLNVTARAEAKRSPVVISLVLDRSGSMKNNGGYRDLPPAVDDFTDYFDDSIDRMSMVSFATNKEVNVNVKKNFKSTVHAVTKTLGYTKFQGGTYAYGGLVNGKAQNDTVVDPEAIKVVVFFTDGFANMNQDTLSCSNRPLLYGGCSGKEQGCGNYVWNTNVDINADQTSRVPCNSNTFPSQETGRQKAFNPTNIGDEAEYRTEQLANTLRSQGTTVFAIGLGEDERDISVAFLKRLANAPDSDTFNSSQPQGLVVIAPTSADLEEAFRRVAESILFRLTE